MVVGNGMFIVMGNGLQDVLKKPKEMPNEHPINLLVNQFPTEVQCNLILSKNWITIDITKIIEDDETVHLDWIFVS